MPLCNNIFSIFLQRELTGGPSVEDDVELLLRCTKRDLTIVLGVLVVIDDYISVQFRWQVTR
jgi:hypothetical protein